MTYKNIIFDLDDTLYDHLLPFKKSIHHCFPQLKQYDIEQMYKRFRYWSDVIFPKFTSNEVTIDEVRIFRCRKTLEEYNILSITDNDALAFQKQYEEELSRITLIPDIESILKILTSDNISTGIITNGPTAHQMNKLEKIHALDYFNPQSIIISQSVGYQKPQVEIFVYTQNQLKISPSETLYIGDNFENDIRTSSLAGWTPIWFNHRHNPTPKDNHFSYFEVNTASDLKTLIIKLLNLQN